MDRRRVLLLVFTILVIVAAGDVYVNRLGLFEQFAQGFTFQVGDETPQRTVELQTVHDAAGIERLLMDEQGSIVVVVGDATNEITIKAAVDIFAANAEEADAFANELRIEAAEDRGELAPKLVVEQRKGVRRTVTWELRVPEHLAVEVGNRLGFIAVSNVGGPVDVRGSGSIDIENIGGAVTVHNELGLLTIRGVGGDAFVQSSFGSALLTDIAGNLEIHTSTSDSRIRNVGGYVTAENRLGAIEIDQVGGEVTIHQTGGGSIIARGTMDRVDVEAEFGNVTIEPWAAAPIEATVRQGVLNLRIPSHLLTEYHYTLDAASDDIATSAEFTQIFAEQGELIDQQPVQITVRNGQINLLRWN